MTGRMIEVSFRALDRPSPPRRREMRQTLTTLGPVPGHRTVIMAGVLAGKERAVIGDSAFAEAPFGVCICGIDFVHRLSRKRNL